MMSGVTGGERRTRRVLKQEGVDGKQELRWRRR